MNIYELEEAIKLVDSDIECSTRLRTRLLKELACKKLEKRLNSNELKIIINSSFMDGEGKMIAKNVTILRDE